MNVSISMYYVCTYVEIVSKTNEKNMINNLIKFCAATIDTMLQKDFGAPCTPGT